MLAKMWKKVLLAICIIACIFNIMSKLVNRHSLKENLESANDGITVFSIFQSDEVVETESKPIIDGVMNPEPEEVEDEKNTSVISTYQTDETVNNTENVVVEIEEVTENTAEQTEENTTTVETTTEEENKENKPFKFSDFTILF